MIAALNVFNALFMVISALLAMLMLGVIGLSIPEFFLVLSIMNLIVAGFVYQQVPDFALRFVIWVLSHTVYRVSHHHLDRIPEDGPALLVCNHVSYMDALVIAGAVRRPVRFVMDHNIFSTPIMGSFFRLAKTIPIGPKSRVPEIYEAAFDRIDEELAAGHLVCIFPEGKLTKDGEVDTFKSGVDMILQRRPVTVVPMALRGLWGSFFSHCGGPAFSHLPKRFWSGYIFLPITLSLRTRPGPLCSSIRSKHSGGLSPNPSTQDQNNQRGQEGHGHYRCAQQAKEHNRPDPR